MIKSPSIAQPVQKLSPENCFECKCTETGEKIKIRSFNVESEPFSTDHNIFLSSRQLNSEWIQTNVNLETEAGGFLGFEQ